MKHKHHEKAKHTTGANWAGILGSILLPPYELVSNKEANIQLKLKCTTKYHK
jgi:hypothetical protein